MQIAKNFNYPVLDRTTHEDGTRFYICPETAKPLPSVTTILSETADKTALKLWEEHVGEKKAKKERDNATALGSLMHAHLENFVEGVERPGGNNLIRMMAKRMSDVVIARGLIHVSEVWGLEVPLYYPGLFAGTTDLVGKYYHRPAIMDYKTTKKIKTREMIWDYFDQLAAYSIAHNEVYGTSIDVGVIFMVSRDLQFEQFVIEGDDFERHKISFLNRLEAFNNKGTPVVAS